MRTDIIVSSTGWNDINLNKNVKNRLKNEKTNQNQNKKKFELNE